MHGHLRNTVSDTARLSNALHTCSHHTAMTDTSFHVTLDGNVIFCKPQTTYPGVACAVDGWVGSDAAGARCTWNINCEYTRCQSGGHHDGV